MMTTYLKLFLFLSIGAFMVLSCSQKKLTGNSSEPVYNATKVEQLAKEQFKQAYYLLDNSSKTFSIAVTKHKEMHDLFPEVQFFVYDHQAAAIIFSDRLKAGAVKWESDNVIQAVARNLSKEANDGKNRIVYYYDVLTKVKRVE